MWSRTLKLFVAPAAALLLLGGCEFFRTYVYDPGTGGTDIEAAALESEPADEASKSKKKRRSKKSAKAKTLPPKKAITYVPPGVMIAPILGAPVASGRRMSAHIANELLVRQVRASNRSDGKITYILQGKAFLKPAGQGRSDFRIDWNLIAPDGLSAGRFSDRVPVAGSGWNAVTPGVMEPMARRAAAQVDVILKGHARAPDALPVDTVTSQELDDALQEVHVLRLLTPVFIAPVDGAPGDGRLSLRNALTEALLKARVPVVTKYSEDGFIVLCDVHITPFDQTRNLFEITWMVMRNDGETVGTAASSMTVGVDRVNPAWGSVAVEAVDSVIGDIVALIDRAGS